MSKMKELDMVAETVADTMAEHLDHNISWAIDSLKEAEEIEGDQFCELINHIRLSVLQKLQNKYKN